MNLEADLAEVKDKVEAVLGKVRTAEPTMAELVFKAVEEVFLAAGYVAPAAPTVEPTAEGVM